VLTVTTGNTITQNVAVPAGSSAAGTAAAAIVDNIENILTSKLMQLVQMLQLQVQTQQT